MVLTFLLDASVQDSFGMTLASPVSQQPQDSVATEGQKAAAPAKKKTRRTRKKKRRSRRRVMPSRTVKTATPEVIDATSPGKVDMEKPVVAEVVVEKPAAPEVVVEEPAAPEVVLEEPAVPETHKKSPIERKREMTSPRQSVQPVKTSPVVSRKPMEEPSAKEKSSKGLPTIAFAAGSSVVGHNQMEKLAELASYLRNHPRAKIVIKGKTARTDAVRNALISRYGINSDRLVAETDANASAVTFIEK